MKIVFFSVEIHQMLLLQVVIKFVASCLICITLSTAHISLFFFLRSLLSEAFHKTRKSKFWFTLNAIFHFTPHNPSVAKRSWLRDAMLCKQCRVHLKYGKLHYLDHCGCMREGDFGTQISLNKHEGKNFRKCFNRNVFDPAAKYWMTFSLHGHQKTWTRWRYDRVQ